MMTIRPTEPGDTGLYRQPLRARRTRHRRPPLWAAMPASRWNRRIGRDAPNHADYPSALLKPGELYARSLRLVSDLCFSVLPVSWTAGQANMARDGIPWVEAARFRMSSARVSKRSMWPTCVRPAGAKSLKRAGILCQSTGEPTMNAPSAFGVTRFVYSTTPSNGRATGINARPRYPAMVPRICPCGSLPGTPASKLQPAVQGRGLWRRRDPDGLWSMSKPLVLILIRTRSSSW